MYLATIPHVSVLAVADHAGAEVSNSGPLIRVSQHVPQRGADVKGEGLDERGVQEGAVAEARPRAVEEVRGEDRAADAFGEEPGLARGEGLGDLYGGVLPEAEC